MITTILLLAQSTGSEFAVELSNKSATGQISFLSLFLKGGYILIPIVLLSIIAVYLIVKKSLDLRHSLTIDPGFVNYFNDQLRKGDLKAAEKHLNQDQSSYSRIFGKVIHKI